MKALEMQDVLDVLVVPGLGRALDELTKKNGSKRRARILVAQSLDQLRKMMPPPAASVVAAAYGAVQESLTKTVLGPTEPDPHGHDFGLGKTAEGYGVCRCGAVENTDAAIQPCTWGSVVQHDFSDVEGAAADTVPNLLGHDFSHDETLANDDGTGDGIGICRCGAVKNTNEAGQPCPVFAATHGSDPA